MKWAENIKIYVTEVDCEEQGQMEVADSCDQWRFYYQ
jgi:hypothetical protein